MEDALLKYAIFLESLMHWRLMPIIYLELRKEINEKMLKHFSTKELFEELKSREGVETEYAEPHQDKKISINGPAVILIITD